ncbi:MAG TPA: hypothetical protein VL307_10165 [Chitinophagaceae bacterium]|nr:hypothetical protein [Chitinophagaceae bacterium]
MPSLLNEGPGWRQSAFKNHSACAAAQRALRPNKEAAREGGFKTDG